MKISIISSGLEEQNLFVAAIQSAVPSVEVVVLPGLDPTASRGDDSLFPAIFPVVSAQDAVAKGMSDGRDPVETLENWKRSSAEQLTAMRQMRRSLLVMSVYAVATNPGAFALSLGKSFDDDLVSDAIGKVELRLPPFGAINEVLAKALVLADDEAVEISEEIEAMCVGVAPSLSSFSREAVREAWGDATCNEQLETLSEECEVLRVALSGAVEQSSQAEALMETERSKQLELQAHWAGVEKDFTQHLARSEASDKAHSAERDTHLKEIRALQSEVASLGAQRIELAEMLKMNEQNVAELTDERAALSVRHSQVSEEAAALAEKNSALSASEKRLEEEVSLLKNILAELQNASADHAAQAEETVATMHMSLDNQNRQRDALASQLEEITAQRDERANVAESTASKLHNVQVEVTSLHAELNEARRANELVTRDLEMVSETLATVYASNSWKVTGPIRSILTRVRKH